LQYASAGKEHRTLPQNPVALPTCGPRLPAL
jgi:hypothetical protein